MSNSKELGALLPDNIKCGHFLVIASGDGYFTTECKGYELLERWEEMEYGDIGAATDEQRQWMFERMNDMDCWSGDSGFGPAHYQENFEDGHIEVIRMSHIEGAIANRAVKVRQSTVNLEIELMRLPTTAARLRPLQAALDRAAGILAGVDHLTDWKTRKTLEAHPGMSVTGYVLTSEEQALLIDQSACRWLSKEDCWELWHGERNPMANKTRIEELERQVIEARATGALLTTLNVELQKEVETLKDALHQDRTGLAAALDLVLQEIGSRTWITTSRGSYEWDDDRYKEEAHRAFQAVSQIARAALHKSGIEAHALCCGRDPRRLEADEFFPIRLVKTGDKISIQTAGERWIFRKVVSKMSIAEYGQLLSDLTRIVDAANPKPSFEDGGVTKCNFVTRNPVKELVSLHGDLLMEYPWCYFELAYTKTTDWMAWVCSKPSSDDPQREVLAHGQGLTPEEACEDALSSFNAKKEGLKA